MLQVIALPTFLGDLVKWRPMMDLLPVQNVRHLLAGDSCGRQHPEPNPEHIYRKMDGFQYY